MGVTLVILVFLIGIWIGFIVLDGGTYLLFALVLVGGFDIARASAMKIALMAAATAACVPQLLSSQTVNWEFALVLTVGSVVGSVIAAKLVLLPGASKWMYRLLVALVVVEVLHLTYTALDG